MKILVGVLILIAVSFGAFVYWLESVPCRRIELGYNCKGPKCECKKRAV